MPQHFQGTHWLQNHVEGSVPPFQFSVPPDQDKVSVGGSVFSTFPGTEDGEGQFPREAGKAMPGRGPQFPTPPPTHAFALKLGGVFPPWAKHNVTPLGLTM